MNSQTLKAEPLVNEFLQSIDDDILNLQLSLIRLDELREAVIKRKDDALNDLNETIRIQNQDHKKVSARRNEIVSRLAAFFGIDNSQFSISFLAEQVDAQVREILLDKQKKLKDLVEKMKTEYSATFMFIQDFARINRMMLNCFVRPSDTGVVYTEKGKSRHEIGQGIINGRI